MKVVILAGGFGTRISEESHLRPKPMIEVGGKPILWHIMKIYSHYGFNDFVICCGYKQYVIKEYFANYFLHNSDITIDLQAHNSMYVHSNVSEPWKVTMIYTGQDTFTGGRVLRIRKYVENSPFFLTYGDGVSNVDIGKLLDFHKAHGKTLTLTAVQSRGKFGALEIDPTDRITTFAEKPPGDGNWINAGFFVANPDIFDHINNGDKSVFEVDVMNSLLNAQSLMAYKHSGFWQPMDTLRDNNYLQELWASGSAPWQVF